MDDVKVACAPTNWNSSGWKDKPWSAPELAPLFTALTSDGTSPTWARRAVLFIHSYTHDHGEALTFREVFEHLAAHDPHCEGHVDAWKSHAVRGLTMSHWRRQGWIHYQPKPRTLRPGPSAKELFPTSTRRTCDAGITAVLPKSMEV